MMAFSVFGTLVLPFLFSGDMKHQGLNHGIKAAIVGSRYLLPIPEDGLINCLVLISMTLQVVLIFAGGIRYRYKSQIFSLVVWLAYMSADGVAMYALGAILDSSRTGTPILYAVWAPVLLLHLGGPDTITAYSMADNELWARHGLTMLYHVSVAAYVIYTAGVEMAHNGQGEWSLLVSAILVFVAGTSKYAERTVALRLASASQIVSSALPIHKFMEHEHEIPKESEDEYEWNYIVMGEEEFYDEFWRKGRKFEWSRRNLRQIGVVTLQDVWEYEGRQATETYKLCAAFAAFKIYTRRFAGLPFWEGDLPKTKRFFITRFEPHVIKNNIIEHGKWNLQVGEREMKFAYDFLFSKSKGTAYSRCGTGLRLANISFLAVPFFFIFSIFEDKKNEKFGLQLQFHGERMVTYILMYAVLVLEVFQLCRILVSDWTMVWLVCANIRLFRRPGGAKSYKALLMKTVMRKLGKVWKLLEDKYWQKQLKIHQHSIIDACLSSSPLLWKVSGTFHNLDFITSLYMEALVPWYIKPCKPSGKDMNLLVLAGLQYAYEDPLTQQELYELVLKDIDIKTVSVEVPILVWHVATTICERFDEKDVAATDDEDVKAWVRLCGMMSRYWSYLIVACPNILPVHPDMAKMEYEKVFSEIAGLVNREKTSASGNEFFEMLRDYENESTLGTGTKLARYLLSQTLNTRWDWISDFWNWMTIYSGFYSKAAVHGEGLTGGGEFLTLVWVPLGHLGMGEQSDSAVGDRSSEWARKRKV